MSATTLMPKSYIAYDTETTGLDYNSQIIQIGMIRLNEKMEETDRSELYCMLNPSNIPAVGAFKTHQIPLNKIMSEGMFEAEFSRAVNDYFQKDPNTCILGYNSIKFDDNKTRELFYRNMLDPYQREYASGNSRYDVLKLTRALKVFKPDAIEWPENEDGTPSMKLEDIAPLNNIIQENAHDAISDVEATIGLMKLIKEKEPDFFDYTMKLRNKAFVSSITYNKPFLMVGDGPSRDHMYTGFMLPVANHPTNKNSTICIALSEMKENDVNSMVKKILSIPAEELESHIYTRDADKKLPIMEVKANQLPFVFTPALLKNEDVQKRTNIDYEECSKNMKSLVQNPNFVELSHHLFHAYKRDMPIPDDVYGQIYKSFTSNIDRKTLSRLSPDNYAEWENIGNMVSDERVPKLIERNIGNIDADLLSPTNKESFEQYMTERYNDKTGKYGETLPKFWADAEDVKKSDTESKSVKDIIIELEKHVDHYASTYAPNMLKNKKNLIEEYREQKENDIKNDKNDKDKKKSNKLELNM